MAIRIISKQDGFRRCGVKHPDQPTVYPNDKFTPEEIKTLQNDPMLIVDIIPDVAAGPEKEVSPVAGMNAQQAIEAVSNLSLEELQLVIKVDERVTVKRAAAEILEKLSAKQPENQTGNDQ